MVWSERFVAASGEFPDRLDEHEEGCKKQIRLQKNACTYKVVISVTI